MDIDSLQLFLLDEIEGEESVSIASLFFNRSKYSKLFTARRTNFRNSVHSLQTPSGSALIITSKDKQNSCIFFCIP